jgi:transcriptional regulator with XRE-family HTH domain
MLSWAPYYNLQLGRLLQLLSSSTPTKKEPVSDNDHAGAESFGRTLKRLRRERGMTQREVASALSIDFTYLSKLENDRGEPPGEETVRKLAEVLGHDTEHLLALAGKVPPELRARAQSDLTFARMLRHLPNATNEELGEIYRRLGLDSDP